MIACASQNSRLILLKYLAVLAVLALLFGVAKIIYIFRARAMRALAARWRFQYLGPSAPKWWNPIHTKISPPVPPWFSEVYISGRHIRQIFNVIEGQQNGVSILIFDSVIGMRGGAGCTLIACQTERNPFGIVSSTDRVTQLHGWTVLHGVWFLHFPRIMGMRRLDHYVKKLRVGSTGEPSC
jgi:hypothetical protein